MGLSPSPSIHIVRWPSLSVLDRRDIAGSGLVIVVQLDPTSDVTLKTMLEQTLDIDVKLRVCQQSLALHDMTLEDVIDGVEILGATSIIDLSLSADHVMYF